MITFAFILLLSGSTIVAASSEFSFGVKKGDWIEYQVSFIGDPSGHGHDVTWARMEITEVQTATITVNITIKSPNGTISNLPPTVLNFETGAITDNFIIPANLQTGESFFNNVQGNITITDVEQKTFAGAERTVLTAATSDTAYIWDKSTGVLIEADTTYTDYAITSKIDRTNMWQPQIFGLDAAAFYTLTTGIAVVLVVLVVVIAVSRRRSRKRPS